MRVLRFKNVLLGLLIVVLMQSLALGQSSAIFDKQKLDTYLEKLAEKNKMMGSLTIDSAGSTVYHKSVGFRDVENNIQANTDTKYRIGSITKTHTATMIMQLVDEDKLALSTPLAGFYPQIPQAENITIEHLLRHQSGLYNFTNAPDFPDWMTEPRSKEELLQIFYEDDSQFEPGAQASYSNTNYVLLQFILEDITGQSYADLLQDRIVDPLNLQHTHYGDRIEPSENEALSYQYQGKKWRAAPETALSIPGGAGAIVSTNSEMIGFIRALFNGKLVSQQSIDKMTDIEQGLGMGLMRVPFNDRYAFGHNGGIDGFQSHLSYFPEEDVSIALATNGLQHSMNDILIGALSIYFGHDFEIPSFDEKTITLSVEQMKKYVGVYTTDQLLMEIEVFIEGSTLKAQATGQQSFPLTANSETKMRFDQAGVVMEFDSLENGKYQHFTLNQGGGSFPFTRKASKEQ
ncbi:peptidase [Aliifodinibius salipaludis]|uniref:Peptidase n=1 Tax=Fodinibius salipaludis TaxID=2032627 RepID=A0A2A2GB15_9BACT|nr:serine hydrolase domain-containing protein [Aliifodinibius salipaludis]PAU94761.1 peptidase [Aliifodinibius salipaludis]